MVASLDEPRAKLGRGLELLDELRAQVNTFPRQVLMLIKRGGLEHVWSVYPERPIPMRWSLLLGDAVHNLRSALDHLVYQLALLQQDPLPAGIERSGAFPVCVTEKDFQKQSHRLAGIDCKAQKQIKALQPFNAPKPQKHPLHWLALLDNIDKHRRLNVVATVVPGVELPLPSALVKSATASPGFIGEGREFTSVVFNEPQQDAVLDISPEVRFVVDEADVMDRGLLELADMMMRHVASAVERLGAFLLEIGPLMTTIPACVLLQLRAAHGQPRIAVVTGQVIRPQQPCHETNEAFADFAVGEASAVPHARLFVLVKELINLRHDSVSRRCEGGTVKFPEGWK